MSRLSPVHFVPQIKKQKHKVYRENDKQKGTHPPPRYMERRVNIKLTHIKRLEIQPQPNKIDQEDEHGDVRPIKQGRIPATTFSKNNKKANYRYKEREQVVRDFWHLLDYRFLRLALRIHWVPPNVRIHRPRVRRRSR